MIYFGAILFLLVGYLLFDSIITYLAVAKTSEMARQLITLSGVYGDFKAKGVFGVIIMALGVWTFIHGIREEKAEAVETSGTETSMEPGKFDGMDESVSAGGEAVSSTEGSVVHAPSDRDAVKKTNKRVVTVFAVLGLVVFGFVQFLESDAGKRLFCSLKQTEGHRLYVCGRLHEKLETRAGDQEALQYHRLAAEMGYSSAALRLIYLTDDNRECFKWGLVANVLENSRDIGVRRIENCAVKLSEQERQEVVAEVKEFTEERIKKMAWFKRMQK